MTIADSVDASQHDIFKVRERRMGARSEGKLTEIRLRDALEREKILLREKKELIRRLFALQGNAANHLAGLTLRQRQIMEQVLAGQPSKNIATDLGISQRTVENHRASIMKKTGCKSLPALIRLALSAAWNGADEAGELAIPFMKGYTVFNVEQIDGLPEPFYAKAEPRGDTVQRIANETASLPRPAQTCAAEPAQLNLVLAQLGGRPPTSMGLMLTAETRTRALLPRQV
jgi:DNA-binding CsgD family transcriptional regulator